jgi:hypothetical protein
MLDKYQPTMDFPSIALKHPTSWKHNNRLIKYQCQKKVTNT